MIVPAFAYLYTNRKFPARGILAWAALEESSSTRRSWAIGHLARLFNISSVNARVLLRKGDGVFWRLTRRNVIPYSRNRLWATVAKQSTVPQEEYVNVPETALPFIALSRAYLAQPALTRGPKKPVSVAVSAQLLGCGRRAVTTYRSRLAGAGRLKMIPQFERLREETIGRKVQTFQPGEFSNKGWIYRRTADIVLITNGVDDILTWPIHIVKGRVLAPRKYFAETKHLERWIAQGKALAKDAVLFVFKEWLPVANVLSAVRGDLYTNTKSLYHAQNVRSERRLVKSFGAVYGNRHQVDIG